MADFPEVQYCNYHGLPFAGGDTCPICESEMWDYAIEVYEFNLWLNTMLVYENQAIIHNGDVYWLMIEQDPEGEYIYTIEQIPDTVKEEIPF